MESPARNIEPSTISRFSVESHRSEYRTIHDLMVQRGRSCSEYRTIHDIVVQRGKSPLWISNHPRYRGSAWKVTALNIEPSTISWFSVESHRSEYRTIHDIVVQRGRSPLCISNHPRYHGSAWKVPTRKPSQSGRSAPTAELAQPALSSRRAYIPAALTPDLPSTHLVTQHPPVQE